jgi:hypothetical protein
LNFAFDTTPLDPCIFATRSFVLPTT